MKVAMIDRASVPCGSCHLCCHSDIIMLLPDEGDDIASYRHHFVDLPDAGRVAVIDKNGNDCVYLIDGKCSIHDRAPKICRVFDCRRWFLSKSRKERRLMVKRGLADKAIFEAGRERLSSLKES